MDGKSTTHKSDRAQSWTLESITASLFLIMAVLFALQTPAFASINDNGQTERLHHRATIADDSLDAAVAMDSLKSTLLYYDSGNRSFVGANSTKGYYTDAPPTKFGELLDDVFGQNQVSFNVYAQYQTPTGEAEELKIVYQGDPTDNAISQSRTVFLYDEMEFSSSNPNTLEEDPVYPIPNVDSESLFYNSIEVKLIVWK